MKVYIVQPNCALRSTFLYLQLWYTIEVPKFHALQFIQWLVETLTKVSVAKLVDSRRYLITVFTKKLLPDSMIIIKWNVFVAKSYEWPLLEIIVFHEIAVRFKVIYTDSIFVLFTYTNKYLR